MALVPVAAALAAGLAYAAVAAAANRAVPEPFMVRQATIAASSLSAGSACKPGA